MWVDWFCLLMILYYANWDTPLPHWPDKPIQIEKFPSLTLNKWIVPFLALKKYSFSLFDPYFNFNLFFIRSSVNFSIQEPLESLLKDNFPPVSYTTFLLAQVEPFSYLLLHGGDCRAWRHAGPAPRPWVPTRRGREPAVEAVVAAMLHDTSE